MPDKTGKGRPVFLHGMWRSGSTFVWSCFRKIPETLCFYEPLHHGLSRLTLDRINRDTAESISTNRHTALDDPYFTEFAELLNRHGRGVRHFRAGFEWDRYLLKGGDSHPGLERYVAFLIDTAQARGKTPVLGFNRTNLRIFWLRERFPAASHIYIERAASDIWRSYESNMAQGNYTYYQRWMKIIERNRNHPFLMPLARRLDIKPGIHRIKGEKRHYARMADTLGPQNRAMMVSYLWTLSLMNALSHDTLILDMSRAGESGYVQEIENTVQRRTGLGLSLSGIHPPEGEQPSLSFTEGEEQASRLIEKLALFSFYDKEKLSPGLMQLTPDKQQKILAFL